MRRSGPGQRGAKERRVCNERLYLPLIIPLRQRHADKQVIFPGQAAHPLQLHFSAQHFSAIGFSSSFVSFGHHRKITCRFFWLAEKRKRRRKKGNAERLTNKDQGPRTTRNVQLVTFNVQRTRNNESPSNAAVNPPSATGSPPGIAPSKTGSPR